MFFTSLQVQLLNVAKYFVVYKKVVYIFLGNMQQTGHNKSSSGSIKLQGIFLRISNVVSCRELNYLGYFLQILELVAACMLMDLTCLKTAGTLTINRFMSPIMAAMTQHASETGLYTS